MHINKKTTFILCDLSLLFKLQETCAQQNKVVSTRCQIIRLKMHHNQFRRRLCPRRRWESLQCSADSIAGFKGPSPFPSFPPFPFRSRLPFKPSIWGLEELPQRGRGTGPTENESSALYRAVRKPMVTVFWSACFTAQWLKFSAQISMI